MTAPHRTAPHRLLLCLSVYLTGADAWAVTCGSWNAGYGVGLASGKESSALAHTWNVVTNCDTFTFHHYLTCHFDDVAGTSMSAPNTPTDSGVTCKVLSSTRTATSHTEHVWRSNRKYAATIFACQSTPGCGQYYGDGVRGAPGGPVQYDKSQITTEPEHWLLVDMEGYDDTDSSHRLLYGVAANGPAAMFYPTGFDEAGYLALWYMENVGGTNTINYQKAEDPGWRNFVTADWTSPVAVAEESNGGEWDSATNPWVVPAVNTAVEPYEYYVRMFLQVGLADGDYNINSINSIDDEGTDFDLACGSSPTCSVSGGGTCAVGDLCDYDSVDVDISEICATVSSSACSYLDHAAHGRIGWNSTDDGAVDFDNDEPFMLLSGTGHMDDCDHIPDDVYEAMWTPGSPGDGTWYVDFVTSPDNCPIYEFLDGHDPYIVPLPNGGFKAYYNRAPEDGNAAVVCHSDDGAPGTWEDCVEIQMAFDDGSIVYGDTDDPHACVGDTEMFVVVDSFGARHEAGFTDPQGSPCFDNSTGLIFIDHKN